jgi:Cu+-exporting ATPase
MDMKIVSEQSTAQLSKATVNIQGMTCASCVKAIETALLALPSVQQSSVAVNLLVGSATLIASPDLCPPSLITETIENAGYDVTLCKYTEPVITPTSKPNNTTSSSSSLSTLNRVTLNISGMFCGSCSSKVEALFESLQGVIPTSIKVSVATGNAQFEYSSKGPSSSFITTSSIADKIRELGFEADNISIEKINDDDRTIIEATDLNASSLTTTRLDISGMTCASCVSAIECKSLFLSKTFSRLRLVSTLYVPEN